MEFVNNLTSTGLPPHHLYTRNGMVFMFLQNLSPKQGLFNGTRLIINKATNIFLYCRITSGDYAREEVLIPRIEINRKDEQFIEWNQHRFQVWPAIAMAFNKCNGLTLKKWEFGWRSLHSFMGSSMSQPPG